MKSRIHLVALAAACALVAFHAGTALAQADAYPARAVRLIVPFPAGGGNDNVARPIAVKVAEYVGQPVVIDNKPGAGTMIGAEAAARSAPDGYTLFLASVGSHGVNPNLYKKVPYDPVKDFDPISLLATASNLMVTRKDAPWKTVNDFVAAARAAPGKYTYASPGIGTPAHLAAEMFKAQTGIDILHVPYKGGANYLPDVVTGRVDIVFDSTTSSIPFMKSGQLVGVAISREARLLEFPDVPTFAEAGYPQFQSGTWYGVLAPAGTPRAAIEKLNRAFQRAVQDPEIASRLRGLGADPVGNSPQAFAAFIRAELAKYAKVIRDNNITAE